MSRKTHTYNSNDLGRFTSLVFADAALAERLSRLGESGDFVREVERVAQARGISLNGDLLKTGPDPLGLVRWTPPRAQGAAWPPPPWLPLQVSRAGERLFVDWAYFGTAPLTKPFFEDSIRRAMGTPFNRLFRHRMTLADFLNDVANHRDALAPDGFIFHMSRCGSTLAAQMLAAAPQSIVISEAAPIDTVVQLNRAQPGMSDDEHAGLLTAMVAAFGRRRAGDERRYFIKLDAWHTLALPLIRRAFPDVPWVFLYRDPVEVLVSQVRQPGSQMVPQIVHPSLYGIEPSDAFPDLDYCARVLNRICSAALAHSGGGLAINYRELPDALFTKILPQFAVDYSESERDLMRLAATRDAKAPSMAFAQDSEEKQREATGPIRAAADRHLGDVYRRLEAWRG